MLLFWRIRYLDSRDRKFKDRDLWLDTGSLDAATRAAVEATTEIHEAGTSRDMLRFRHFFRRQDLNDIDVQEALSRSFAFATVSILEYFEDENGQELSLKRMAEILSGNPNAVMFRAGAKQHDIDFAMADKSPIHLDKVYLSDEDLEALGYFTRDIREMLSSAFMQEGPGTLGSCSHCWTLKTAVSDEEIRSFTTIFRRLYMASEPANFLKSVAVFSKAIAGHPLSRWITGVAEEYEKKLDEKPDFVPMADRENWSFSRKRLIDVYMYTRYAHQPDKKRSRQFAECLASVKNQQAVLTWLFLVTLYKCALHMWSVGRQIASFYDAYCGAHGRDPKVLAPLHHDNPGIGSKEKKEDRTRRILDEKAVYLARALWEQAGSPEGGYQSFMDEGLRSLNDMMPGAMER